MPLLLCDLDDTILDRAAIFSLWANEWARERRLDASLVEWVVENDAAGYRPREELWSLVKSRLSLEEPVDELVSLFRREFAACVFCREEVADTLRRARTLGWRIAIVTNGDAYRNEKIDRANLRPLVDVVCISEVEGARKPEPRLFEIAAQRCGASLDGAWMIGDNAQSDIGGAAACGIDSARMSLGRAWPEALEFRPTYEAASFVDAFKHISTRARPV